MKRENLSERMKREAVGLGLCRQWTEEWEKGATKDDMVDKFVRGLDFCIEHDWPSTEVIKKDFGDVIHRHGVWVDEHVSLSNPETAVLNGHCDARVSADGFSVCSVYVRHRSRLALRASGMAYVRVSVYDDADVEIRQEGHAKCYVYRHGGKVRTEGDVRIREEGQQ